MKLAKRATGRRSFVACRDAYHGSTQGALSLMDSSYFTAPFRPLLPDVRHMRYNHFEDLDLIDAEVAAVVIEPVQAESGVRKPVAGYLQAVADRCKAAGALLIFDEAQTGFGRTGLLWGYEHSGVVPDIMLMAKGMGGGMPIGAFVAPHALMHLLTHDPVLGHITTFGGHPMSAAAALATLQELTQSSLVAQVPAKEQLFLSLLKHPAIVEVRSAGLWLAVELASNGVVLAVIADCLEQGLITDWFLFNDRSLRIAPPLTISDVQIEWACRVIIQALDRLV
jgi:acetylornithine/succinyldiaminopimelate/putrescine aminotransferase